MTNLGDFKLRNLNVAEECAARRASHLRAVLDYKGFPFADAPESEGG